jgi:hypothetical protein
MCHSEAVVGAPCALQRVVCWTPHDADAKAKLHAVRTGAQGDDGLLTAGLLKVAGIAVKAIIGTVF